MVELVGGRIAEQVYFPQHEPLPALHDEVEAAAFASLVCISPELVSGVLRLAEIEAHNLIIAHRDISEALIDALAARGVLSGGQVDEIIS